MIEANRYAKEAKVHPMAAIILNYNSWKDTCTCVQSVIKQSLVPNLIIVDNCSTDNSFQKLRQFCSQMTAENPQLHIDCIQSPNNGGYSAGNNYGIHYAEKKYKIDTILILNPDVILTEKDFLADLRHKLYANEKIAIIGGMSRLPGIAFNRNRVAWAIPSGWELVKTQFVLTKACNVPVQWEPIADIDNLDKVDCVVGCMFMAKLEYFKNIGYFDDHVFLYNEETLLGIACKQHGYIEAVSTDNYYIHNHKPAVPKKGLYNHLHSIDHMFHSRAYLCEKYYGKKWLLLLYLIQFLNKICLFIGYFKSYRQRKHG